MMLLSAQSEKVKKAIPFIWKINAFRAFCWKKNTFAYFSLMFQFIENDFFCKSNQFIPKKQNIIDLEKNVDIKTTRKRKSISSYWKTSFLIMFFQWNLTMNLLLPVFNYFNRQVIFAQQRIKQQISVVYFLLIKNRIIHKYIFSCVYIFSFQLEIVLFYYL